MLPDDLQTLEWDLKRSEYLKTADRCILVLPEKIELNKIGRGFSTSVVTADDSPFSDVIVLDETDLEKLTSVVETRLKAANLVIESRCFIYVHYNCQVDTVMNALMDLHNRLPLSLARVMQIQRLWTKEEMDELNEWIETAELEGTYE